MLYQDNYFFFCVKLNFCWRQTHCIDDQDTSNEFTDCQTPRKKLQSTGISPVNWHAFIETFKSDISDVCKVQVDCLKDS